MSSSHQFLKSVRLVHLYLGIFIAPMLVFFSCTGFIQTFSLHETTKGRDYTPPSILVKLGQFHKKQTLIVPTHKMAPPLVEGAKAKVGQRAGESHGAGEAKAAAKPAEAPVKAKNLWPMKIFFGLVAIGLLTSTLSGIYMSYKYVRNRVLTTCLLVAGVVVPVVLTVF